MRGFSKAIITGNLTRDPELRTLPSGTQVCSFTVAVNRSYKDSSGNQQEAVSFLDCSAWSKMGEIINQYARKGSGILVSGRLEQRSWTDKEGQKRSRVEIVVEDFNFMGGGNSNNNNNLGNGTSSFGAAAAVDEMSTSDEVVPDDVPEEPINMEDIPF